MKANYLLFIMPLLSSCNNERSGLKSNDSTFQKDNQIAIIFEAKEYSNDTLKFVGGGFSPTLNPIIYSKNNSFEVFKINPNNTFDCDTITLNTDRGITLEHKYLYYYKSLYNFMPGDSVLFKYKDGVPYAELLNREFLYNDLNFQTDFNLKVEKPINREEFFLRNKRFRNHDELMTYGKSRANVQLKNMKAIDSLSIKNLISQKAYTTLKQTLRFENPSLHIKDYDAELKKDSLLQISSYRNFLDNYSRYKFKIGSLKKTKYQTIIDFKSSYDSISENPQIYSSKTQDYLMFEYLKNIAREFSLKDFEFYYKKFTEQVNDSSLINQIKRNYLMDLSTLKKETKNVHLLNLQKEKFLLEDILAQNRGEVIYIDFWASWCVPCIAAMPASKELREKYEGDNISFIYISIDKDYTRWDKANAKVGLEFSENSFLTINYPNVAFYKSLKLDRIPRYMIYNKKGELVHTNAISPNSEDIEKTLNKYLEE